VSDHLFHRIVELARDGRCFEALEELVADMIIGAFVADGWIDTHNLSEGQLEAPRRAYDALGDAADWNEEPELAREWLRAAFRAAAQGGGKS
jgi:hypothetical protein